MSIYDLVTELQSFTTIPANMVERAQQSEINTENNTTFRELAMDWANGVYDEDVELVVQQINGLLTQAFQSFDPLYEF